MKKVLTKLSPTRARDIWIDAQKLNKKNYFGKGPEAVEKAILHLGYVQIDTISVIERCHHHILFNRIPSYKRSDLEKAQSQHKTVFEYWTHALSYVATEDYKYFIPAMKAFAARDSVWFKSVTAEDYKKVLNLLKKEGAISIRDIKDDVLVEKTHLWGSSKPSKKALQKGFHNGDFVISAREGMLKKYDLRDRHFGWKSQPKMATAREYVDYIIERGLRSQGLISVDSICYLDNKFKAQTKEVLQKKIKSGELAEVQIQEREAQTYFARPEILEQKISGSELTHILSPFDPLIIQRKRLEAFFDYKHIFEAYVPPAKRKYGYFTLPVLSGNSIVALLDLKTQREQKKLQIQSWHWLQKFKSKEHKALIEVELDRFEKFQLASN